MLYICILINIYVCVCVCVYSSAVKRLIAINRIQNKSLFT